MHPTHRDLNAHLDWQFEHCEAFEERNTEVNFLNVITRITTKMTITIRVIIIHEKQNINIAYINIHQYNHYTDLRLLRRLPFRQGSRESLLKV